MITQELKAKNKNRTWKLGKKYFGVAKCKYNVTTTKCRQNEMTSKPSRQKPTKQNVSTMNNCFTQTTGVMQPCV